MDRRRRSNEPDNPNASAPNILQILHPENLQMALSNLDVHSLARLVATARGVQSHIVDELRRRVSDRHRIQEETGTNRFEYTNSDQDGILIGFSTRASYLAWLEYVTETINDTDYHIRIKALQMLGELSPEALLQPQYIDAIFSRVRDENAHVRKQALQTIMQKLDPGILRDPLDPKEYTGAVVGRLVDTEDYVRITALKILHKLDYDTILSLHEGYNTWFREFTQMIVDQDDAIRMVAMRNLHEIGPVAVGQPTPRYVSYVVTRLREDPNIGVRGFALRTMEKFGQVVLEANVALIVDTLDVPDLSMFALSAMQKLSGNTLANYARRVANRLSSEDAEVRNLALETLQNLEPAILANYQGNVLTMLTDPDRDVRRTALETLQKLEPASIRQYVIIGIVIRLKDEKDKWLILDVLQTLSMLEPTELAKYVWDIIPLFDHECQWVRQEAIKTLGKLEPNHLMLYTGHVVRMLKDDKTDVHEEALHILHSKLEPAVLAELLSYYMSDIVQNLQHQSDDVKKTALKAMYIAGPVEFKQHAGDVIYMLRNIVIYDDGVRYMALLLLNTSEAVRTQYPDIFHDPRNQRDLRFLRRNRYTLMDIAKKRYN